MGAPAETGLTYADLRQYPEDNVRREIVDGVLYVTPSPSARHQWVSLLLASELLEYVRREGGRVYPALDTFFSDTTVVEPDLVVVRAEHLGRVEAPFVRGAPDLVVEVSSPSTRRRDLGIKRDLYEREGVAEYWFVDLDAERMEVYRLGDDGRYGAPLLVARGERYESAALPGFVLETEPLFADDW